LYVDLAGLEVDITRGETIAHGVERSGAIRRFDHESHSSLCAEFRIRFANGSDRGLAGFCSRCEAAARPEFLGQASARRFQLGIESCCESLQFQTGLQTCSDLVGSLGIDPELARPIDFADRLNAGKVGTTSQCGNSRG
jgi:hypothetical protein